MIYQKSSIVTSSHLPDSELFVRDSTAAWLVHLKGVLLFYLSFVQKMLKKFDFKSQLFHIPSFLDPWE